jgi:hypothetical protein
MYNDEVLYSWPSEKKHLPYILLKEKHIAHILDQVTFNARLDLQDQSEHKL